MLQQAHVSLEMMSALASAVKDERWGEAERILLKLKVSLDVLGEAIGNKAREGLNVPRPDNRDRG
jgi:hypothetical protein